MISKIQQLIKSLAFGTSLGSCLWYVNSYTSKTISLTIHSFHLLDYNKKTATKSRSPFYCYTKIFLPTIHISRGLVCFSCRSPDSCLNIPLSLPKQRSVAIYLSLDKILKELFTYSGGSALDFHQIPS